MQPAKLAAIAAAGANAAAGSHSATSLPATGQSAARVSVAAAAGLQPTAG